MAPEGVTPAPCGSAVVRFQRISETEPRIQPNGCGSLNGSSQNGGLLGKVAVHDSFCLTRKQLAAFPNSLLHHLVEDVTDDVVEVPDDEPARFRLVGEIYRSAAVHCSALPPTVTRVWLQEALDRYGLPSFGSAEGELRLVAPATKSHLQLLAYNVARNVVQQVLDLFPTSAMSTAVGVNLFALPLRDNKDVAVFCYTDIPALARLAACRWYTWSSTTSVIRELRRDRFVNKTGTLMAAATHYSGASKSSPAKASTSGVPAGDGNTPSPAKASWTAGILGGAWQSLLKLFHGALKLFYARRGARHQNNDASKSGTSREWTAGIQGVALDSRSPLVVMMSGILADRLSGCAVRFINATFDGDSVLLLKISWEAT